MPIRASLHFHFYETSLWLVNQKLCQCPFGLLFISTCAGKTIKMSKKDCVNAHSGFSSFPLSRRIQNSTERVCVNAHSGFSSFPLWFCNRNRRICWGVNAHSGFSSFPQNILVWNYCYEQVSMPIRASLHFHIPPEQFGDNEEYECQCPFGLLFISTWN